MDPVGIHGTHLYHWGKPLEIHWYQWSPLVSIDTMDVKGPDDVLNSSIPIDVDNGYPRIYGYP